MLWAEKYFGLKKGNTLREKEKKGAKEEEKGGAELEEKRKRKRKERLN